ncbi:MAG: hypothetical protein J5599_00180, partial [Spirochaetales bacterium]|nr:hypothetical protein [Spirochaetales bacterium]
MKKTLVFALLICMILPLCACTVRSEPYATYGKYEITVNMFEYWIAYYKARFYSSFAGYGLVDGEYDESVWDQTADGDTPLSQQITEHVDGQINEMLICAELYDSLGLSKNAQTKKQLSDTVDGLIDQDISAAVVLISAVLRLDVQRAPSIVGSKTRIRAVVITHTGD